VPDVSSLTASGWTPPQHKNMNAAIKWSTEEPEWTDDGDMEGHSFRLTNSLVKKTEPLQQLSELTWDQLFEV
jgi:hypothetical protein